MRQDLGTAHDGQFKKIYMSRHENVRLVRINIQPLILLHAPEPVGNDA